MGSLTITYSGDHGTLPLAVIRDARLLRLVARAVIRKAERSAVRSSKTDPLMGHLKMLEVARLEAALSAVIPGMGEEQISPATQPALRRVM